jgi:hypothetical protein
LNASSRSSEDLPSLACTRRYRVVCYLQIDQAREKWRRRSGDETWHFVSSGAVSKPENYSDPLN